MWTVDNYNNPNITFTRNYGTDTSIILQTSIDGFTWINNTITATSPLNIGTLPYGAFIRLVSTSDSTISNTITVSGIILE